MGTNYYVQPKPCECCGRTGEQVHIGKSSSGWVFGLHVIPELGLNDLANWETYWQDKQIVNEYGEVIEPSKMHSIIAERAREGRREANPWGYSSWEQFHQQNHSVDGPNNLIRSRIDGGHCIGHGAGTWDLIVGEFS